MVGAFGEVAEVLERIGWVPERPELVRLTLTIRPKHRSLMRGSWWVARPVQVLRVSASRVRRFLDATADHTSAPDTGWTSMTAATGSGP